MRYFLSEPYLLSLSPKSEMYIVWIQSVKNDDAYIEFGLTDTLGQKLHAECHEITGLRLPDNDGKYTNDPDMHTPVSVWQYIVKITDLSPSQTVYYRVVSCENKTQIYSFHTAPEEGQDFRFLQLSDLQGLGNCHEAVYAAGCKHPDLILYSGDCTYVSWRIDSWFDVDEPWQSREEAAKAFFPCMQQQNGARLMQYAPIFVCPGNHELDDIRVYGDKELYLRDDRWNWSIFMQMFRPYYSLEDTGLDGRRWYSADYGDMHIISLSINRLCFWNECEYPGWRLYDSIDPEGPQIKWLIKDLESCDKKFKWVIQHFHILNKGWDVQFNLCAPVFGEDGTVTYPNDHGGMLMDIYSRYGVNGVSFGHSHVYERYYTKGTHYIEAAYLSVCFRRGGEAPHPSGLLPIVEDNSQRSFLVVERNGRGLCATGHYVEGAVPFDSYRIADENGVSVPPEE